RDRSGGLQCVAAWIILPWRGGPGAGPWHRRRQVQWYGLGRVRIKPRGHPDRIVRPPHMMGLPILLGLEDKPRRHPVDAAERRPAEPRAVAASRAASGSFASVRLLTSRGLLSVSTDRRAVIRQFHPAGRAAL